MRPPKSAPILSASVLSATGMNFRATRLIITAAMPCVMLPEAQERKFPARSPVAVAEHDKFIRLTQPVEVPTGTQKELDIPTTIKGNHISIVNRIYNRGLWPVELAPWAYKIMVVRRERYRPHAAVYPAEQRRSVIAYYLHLGLVLLRPHRFPPAIGEKIYHAAAGQ